MRIKISAAYLKKSVFILLLSSLFVAGGKNVFAQANSVSVLYVPLIGITAVPEPLALPKGPGNVIYHYAIKNFLQELPLTGVQVFDDKCSPVIFTEGDDNRNGRLEYSETWRYTCTTKIFITTQSTATVTGSANNINATHSAYATVVVGSSDPPPLVSIVNITKVAYPLSLPADGGVITFTYKVNNPGAVPLSDVTVDDDKCSAMSGRLGDTNGNNLLDVNEVWIYTCAAVIKQTTTNTANVVAFANGLRAVGSATITVRVDSPVPGLPNQPVPNLPNTGGGRPSLKIIVWTILEGILAALIIIFFLIRKNKTGKT